MRSLSFRLFRHEDLPLYLEWVNQREIWEVDSSEPFTMKTTEAFQQQGSKIVDWARSWLIFVDGRPIGYVGFVSDEHDQLTDEFFIVIGDTTQWGKGYGRQAMQWLVDKAAELGLTRLRGQVLGNNARALAFYEALGFRKVGEGEPRFERNGAIYNTVVVARPLRGNAI
jgi:RimJ/RimL family protein N-acetyltransferase